MLLTYYRCNDLEPENIECIWVSVNIHKTKPLLIGTCTIYRSLSGRVNYLDKIECSIASSIAHGKETIIVGDMNIDLLSKQKKGLVKRIMDISGLYQLKQLVNEPTTSTFTTLIDHIYTN